MSRIVLLGDPDKHKVRYLLPGVASLLCGAASYLSQSTAASICLLAAIGVLCARVVLDWRVVREQKRLEAMVEAVAAEYANLHHSESDSHMTH